MRAVLDRLAGLKRRFLFALLQIRTASAALSLGDIRSFNEFIAGSAPGFSDLTGLTRWTKGFLYADVVRLIAEWSTQALMVTAGTVRPWEVVGFFLPPGLFWKPYQVMQENHPYRIETPIRCGPTTGSRSLYP